MTSKIDKGYIHSMTEINIEFKSTLLQTIACSLETITQHIEQNIAQILIDIYQTQPMQQQYEPQRRSYTTPTFVQFLQICLNFRRLRNEKR